MIFKLKKWSLKNNLSYYKHLSKKNDILSKYTLVYSILLKLCMRTNGKCNNSQAPKQQLKWYSVFPQNLNITEGPEYKIYQHYIDVRGKVYQLDTEIYQLL